MVYIGYLNDRKKLGFSCIKDINAIKQLSYLIKNPVTLIIRKGKQTVILIFSKEVLVAIFIFLNSSCIEPNFDPPSFTSSEVYQACVIKSDNLRFLNYPPRISDFILKLNGGSDELSIEEQEKLINSILSRTSESDIDEMSINKFLQRLGEIIYPVISNKNLWRVLNELQKPLKSKVSDGNLISSTDIIGTTQNVQDKQPKLKGSSSIFAEAFTISNSRKLSPMQNRVQLKMAKNNLESSGLSQNHEQLSENIQFVEKLTRLRRAEPLYPSQVLGDSYKYGGKQLERKASSHLEDFGICTEGKTIEEMAIEYNDLLENLLSKPNLVIREDGRLNKREPTINIGDPKSLRIVSFENNPLYEDHHFISGYPISEKAFETFRETGNIGSGPKERAQEINELQRIQAQAERERQAARSFYTNLPEEARIGNQQLREVESIQERLREDSKSPLTEKEKDMIERAKKYQQYKTQYYQNNANIDRDEF
jgi:hypothetical protein